MTFKQKLEKAQNYTQSVTGIKPEIGVVLGSGMGDLSRHVKNAVVLPAHDIPYYPSSTVHGHKGQWVLGDLAGKPVVIIQGRVHVYEGYSPNEVVFPIHLAANLGIKRIILTTACGGLNPEFLPGQIMLITNHINMAFLNSAGGKPENLMGPRFPVMDGPYDKEMLLLAEKSADNIGINIKKGVFVWVTGPAYETAAEVRMLRKIGGDAVSMSTVPEVIAAKQRHIKTLGISLITNLATGISPFKLSHTEVTETAGRSVKRLSRLVEEIVSSV